MSLRSRTPRLVAAGVGLAAVVIAAVAIAVAVRPSSSDSVGTLVRPATSASRPPAPSQDVPDVLTLYVWELTDVNGSAASIPPQALQIDPTGAMTVDYRCTQWKGSGTFVAPSVIPVGTGTISEGPNWEHTCPAPYAGEPVPTVSQASVNAILSGPIRWSVKSTNLLTLTITKADGRSLNYATATPVSVVPASLMGSWRLVDADGIVAKDGQGIDFLTETTVSVSYGCASWLGSVAAAPVSAAAKNPYAPSPLSILKAQDFQPPCPSTDSSPDAIAIRTDLDAILPGTIHWDVSGTTLTISKVGPGVGELAFSR